MKKVILAAALVGLLFVAVTPQSYEFGVFARVGGFHFSAPHESISEPSVHESTPEENIASTSSSQDEPNTKPGSISNDEEQNTVRPPPQTNWWWWMYTGYGHTNTTNYTKTNTSNIGPFDWLTNMFK